MMDVFPGAQFIVFDVRKINESCSSYGPQENSTIVDTHFWLARSTMNQFQVALRFCM